MVDPSPWPEAGGVQGRPMLAFICPKIYRLAILTERENTGTYLRLGKKNYGRMSRVPGFVDGSMVIGSMGFLS